ncbi:ATP-binding protein [Massilia sp. R2A-15]|uniref:sensor histidine kinase n=1 Tax=Massilia sp. R2A-15 TaxID=3064278 RepID=UPI0027350E15|nr:ATP-binding protein [Massilia sp. R2A-15]WLI91172.1 ATP-binding protein [Massilia sp. R2A-15]
MNRSLQRHLSLTIGAAMMIAALLAAAVSFGFVFLEAREFQDDLLKQVAEIASRRGPVSVTSTRAGGPGGDPDARLTVLRFPGDSPPPWWRAPLREGWYTVSTGKEELRVYVDEGQGGSRTVVAQPTEARDEIARHSAVRAFLPFLLLVLLLPVLTVRIIRRELAPVIRLAHSLDEQSVDRLDPVSDRDVPAEITPFVHAINRLIERANSMLMQQRRFIADAAHELRSPLTALLLQAQNLRNAESLETVRQRVAPLQEGIERARRLTEQLLNLAKAQSGETAAARIDLPGMARELLAEFMPQAERRGIDLGLGDVTPLSIAATPNLLRQILRNALENALNYSPPGGLVSVRVFEQAGEAVVEVVDDGPGVPAAERERVFDSFYRIPGAQGQGSGIGLAIARESALKLGGVISLHERKEATGLVFRYRQKLNNKDTHGFK